MAATDPARADAGAAPAPISAPKPSSEAALDARLDGLPLRARRLLRDARGAIDQRNADGAATLLARAEPFAASHPEYWRLLGVVRHLHDDIDGALAALRRALELKPSDPVILTNLGVALRESGQIDAALATLRRACDLGPDLAATWHNLARTLNAQANVGEANEAFARAVACDPNHTRARLGYAQTLNNLGRTAESADEFRRVLRRDPGAIRAWVALANLKTVRLTAEETAWLDRVYASSGLADDDRIKLGFALAKALEDQGRFEEAFTIYSSANALKRRSMDWDAAAFSRHVDATMAAFTPPPRPAPTKALGREVIFIVSLPRSGSTLTEQILASHPDVEGANELVDMQVVLDEESARRGAPFPQWVPHAKPADWQRMGRRYLERTERWRGARGRFTDKSLGTWRYLGAAATMLPGAHFVSVRRDPVETCLSCFRQLFGADGHAYSYDIAEMAAYWRDYDRLTRFWHAHFPHRVHDFGYEALLGNAEAEVRRLLEFLDLPFDAACLEFHRTERNVRTVSAAQVREPLRGDTARADRYGGLLAPLRLALGQPASATPRPAPVRSA
ncbi:MAG TPA: sulfotransferase [Dokdonella sp.]